MYTMSMYQCTHNGRQTTPLLRGPLGAHKLAGEAHAEVGGSGRRRAMRGSMIKLAHSRRAGGGFTVCARAGAAMRQLSRTITISTTPC